MTADRPSTDPPDVLHLFAYTGLTTLALARAGARVAHVDASRPTVAWARRNAATSGLDDRPIRWLVDDATAFAQREQRRGRRYDGIVLDPPTYGHGGHGGGRVWRIEEDLAPLLATCAALLVPEGFILLTAHTEGLDPDLLAGVLPMGRGSGRGTSRAGALERGELLLETADGRPLALGAFARWDGAS